MRRGDAALLRCMLYLSDSKVKRLVAVKACKLVREDDTQVRHLKGLHASILHCNCALVLFADSPRLLCLQLKLV